jgi:hypothetical protein
VRCFGSADDLYAGRQSYAIDRQVPVVSILELERVGRMKDEG